MQNRVREHGEKILRRFAIRLGRDQHARDFRNLLLERSADIFDERRLDRRILPGLQHAGD